MFDDLRPDDPDDNLGETKPRHLSTTNQRYTYTRRRRFVNFPNPGAEEELNQTPSSPQDKAEVDAFQRISTLLDLPTPPINTTNEDKDPEWLKIFDNSDRLKNEKANSEERPWWMEKDKKPQETDIEETQPIKTVKKEEIPSLPESSPVVRKEEISFAKLFSSLKANKPLQAFFTLISIIIFGNIITWLFPTIFGYIIADLVYITLYLWFASMGYNAKDLFLHPKK